MKKNEINTDEISTSEEVTEVIEEPKEEEIVVPIEEKEDNLRKKTIERWEKSGLLEGLTGPVDAVNIPSFLSPTHSQIVPEIIEEVISEEPTSIDLTEIPGVK